MADAFGELGGGVAHLVDQAVKFAFLHALGGLMGWLAYLASPSYRSRLNANATLASTRSHCGPERLTGVPA